MAIIHLTKNNFQVAIISSGFKDQMVKVKSENANIETYQARISLGINLQDLYN